MKKEIDVLSSYMNEINKIPLLTAEEENALAVQAKNGDRNAAEKIVEANLRFVVKIANEYVNPKNTMFDITDLISEGNIGLLSAIDHFDPSKGIKFISYAVWWIRQSILKAIGEHGRSIRLPQNKAYELTKIEKARKLIDSTLPEYEQYAQIAELTGLEEKTVQDLLFLTQGTVSLEAPIDKKESDSDTIGDMIESYGNDPEDTLMEKSLHQEVRKAIKMLKPREELVLRLRYGFDGEEPKSLKEIGTSYGLTKERVRQIEKTAIHSLQMPSKRKILEDFVA
ncbi:MAG: sigma-70 family RNA polymerase sigma factor [Treponema sp.]|mgnify:CR=1 FL=1|nr:sigma-70 family RNA polymerase sigma factor [Treponema sp.]